MQKNVKIFLIFILFLFVVSCWKSENSAKTWNKTNWVSINSVVLVPTWKKAELNYDQWKDELTVDSVKITSGVPPSFPKWLRIYENAKTYLNSNVENYTYFVLNKDTKTEDVWKYYIDLLNKLWYERINYNEKADSNSLEFVLKNQDYIPLEKRTPDVISQLQKEWKLDSINQEYKSKVSIYINKETPENIKKWMNLEWVFVEIYY